MLVRKDINTQEQTTLSSTTQWKHKFLKTMYRLNIMNWQVIGISPAAVIVSGCQTSDIIKQKLKITTKILVQSLLSQKILWMYYHNWVTVLHFLEEKHNMESQVSKKVLTETHIYCYTCLCLCKSHRGFFSE